MNTSKTIACQALREFLEKGFGREEANQVMAEIGYTNREYAVQLFSRLLRPNQMPTGALIKMQSAFSRYGYKPIPVKNEKRGKRMVSEEKKKELISLSKTNTIKRAAELVGLKYITAYTIVRKWKKENAQPSATC